MNKLTLSVSAILVALIASLLIWLSSGTTKEESTLKITPSEMIHNQIKIDEAQSKEKLVVQNIQTPIDESQDKPVRLYSNLEPMNVRIEGDEKSEQDKKITKIIEKIRENGQLDYLTDQGIIDLLEYDPRSIEEFSLDDEARSISDHYYDFNYKVFFEYGPLSVDNYNDIPHELYLASESQVNKAPDYISSEEQAFIDKMEAKGGINFNEIIGTEGFDFSDGYTVWEEFTYGETRKHVMFYFEESPYENYYLDINNVTDNNLKKCVEEHVKQNEKHIEYFHCNEKIRSLQGLEGLTSIKYMTVQFTGVIDLSPISNYKNITDLEIYTGRDLNAKQLESMTSLKRLTLNGISIKNSEAIKNLTSLTALIAYHVDGFDFSVISEMKNIKSLEIVAEHFNAIDFSELTRLEELTIYTNPSIQLNLNVLNNLSELKKLRIFNTVMTSLPKLNLTNLIELEIEESGLSDISNISHYKSLKMLKLKNNNISNIPNLGQLDNIEIIDVSNNRITDLEFLENTHNLKAAYVYNNGLTDLSPIYNLPNLILLHAQGNQIKDISGIESLSQLMDIILIANPIADCYPATKLQNLVGKHWCEVSL